MYWASWCRSCFCQSKVILHSCVAWSAWHRAQKNAEKCRTFAQIWEMFISSFEFWQLAVLVPGSSLSFLLEALTVGSSGAPLLLRTLVAALSKVEDSKHVTGCVQDLQPIATGDIFQFLKLWSLWRTGTWRCALRPAQLLKHWWKALSKNVQWEEACRSLGGLDQGRITEQETEENQNKTNVTL